MKHKTRKIYRGGVASVTDVKDKLIDLVLSSIKNTGERVAYFDVAGYSGENDIYKEPTLVRSASLPLPRPSGRASGLARSSSDSHLKRKMTPDRNLQLETIAEEAEQEIIKQSHKLESPLVAQVPAESRVDERQEEPLVRQASLARAATLIRRASLTRSSSRLARAESIRASQTAEEAEEKVAEAAEKVKTRPVRIHTSKASASKTKTLKLERKERAEVKREEKAKAKAARAKALSSRAEEVAKQADALAMDAEDKVIYVNLTEDESLARANLRISNAEAKRRLAPMALAGPIAARSHAVRQGAIVESSCCNISTMERLQRIEASISNVHIDFIDLLTTLSQETLGEFGSNQELISLTQNRALATYTGKSLTKTQIATLNVWASKVHELLYGYQRISTEDVKKAFFFLLYSFDPDHSAYVLHEKNEKTRFHELITNYAYKMITSLFTTANITSAVFMYNNPTWPPPWQPVPGPGPGPVAVGNPYDYLRNLLSIMRDGSIIVNTYLRQDCPPEYSEYVSYYHSGGNMIVVIAGMLCYLYDKNREGNLHTYGGDILEQIRRQFHVSIGVRMYEFYEWLNKQMQIVSFRNALFNCTENISDLDFILMAPDHFLNRGLDNPLLIKMHELSARIIRNVLIAAYVPCPMTTIARKLLPFHQKFGPQWSNFRFYQMPTIAMNPLPQADGVTYKGYRQTSNRIDAVPMYLNRLKQGYAPYHTILNFYKIPADVQNVYATKYGECIDLSIGILDNELYRHKHTNYMELNYYTIDTVLWELEKIIQGPRDDKTPKREMRRDFFTMIHTDLVDALFQTIGHIIQHV